MSRELSVQEGLLLGGLCPGVYVQGVSVQGDLCPWWGSLSKGGFYPGCLCPGGSLSRCLCPGGSLSRGSLSRGPLPRGSLSREEVFVQRGVFITETPPAWWKSGQYASYWNASLFKIDLPSFCMITIIKAKST